MPIVRLKCDKGHLITLDVGRPKGFLKLCQQGKRVCPQCKPENVRMSLHEPQNIVHTANKDYVCKHGHVTKLYQFTNGMISISWGDEHENVPGGPQDVPEWIERGTLRCRHTVSGASGRTRKCNCKIKAVDDSVLAYPSIIGIKTRIRVGDIWEREGCPEPKSSHHEVFSKHGKEDARYVETEFTKRNKRRLQKLRKKRQSITQGEILKRPTDRRSDEKLSKRDAVRGARNEYD